MFVVCSCSLFSHPVPSPPPEGLLRRAFNNLESPKLRRRRWEGRRENKTSILCSYLSRFLRSLLFAPFYAHLYAPPLSCCSVECCAWRGGVCHHTRALTHAHTQTTTGACCLISRSDNLAGACLSDRVISLFVRCASALIVRLDKKPYVRLK